MKLKCRIGYHKLVTIKDETFILTLNDKQSGTAHIHFKKCKYCKYIEISLDNLKISYEKNNF